MESVGEEGEGNGWKWGGRVGVEEGQKYLTLDRIVHSRYKVQVLGKSQMPFYPQVYHLWKPGISLKNTENHYIIDALA